jgi:hypothetical protein
MSRNEYLDDLYRRLAAKEDELKSLVANTLGYDLADPGAAARVNEEVEELVDEFEETLMEGDTVEQWKALDKRLASSGIGRLMLERHEIAESILDAEDATNPHIPSRFED